VTSLVGGKTYGTVSAASQKEMSGLEFVQGLVNGTLPLNMIAQTLGYDVVEAVKGRVAVTVEPSEAHLNPYARWSRRYATRQLHGISRAVHSRQGFRADDS
jgi:hypothetical protein